MCPYLVSFVGQKGVVEISEITTLDDERKLSIAFNGASLGEIAFPKYQPFGAAVDNNRLAIWAGRRIFVNAESLRQLMEFELDDEILTAYPLKDNWCLVCETSIVLWSPQCGVLASYEHNEIIVKSDWADNRLLVEDFSGQHLSVTTSDSDLTIDRAHGLKFS